MTVRTYWQLDPAAEPHRLEASARSVNPIVTPLRSPAHNRFDYYAQVAQAAAQTSFDGLFIAHRPEADESRIIAATLAREVPRLTLVPEFAASIGSAVYAAKQASTFQRSTHNRLGWAIAAQAQANERARAGDLVAEDALHERLDEFLTVARGVQTQRPFTFEGTHFEVANGGFDAPLNRVPFPQVFLQGESENEIDLSARHADVHLFGADAPERIASLVEGLDEAAKQADRHVAFGLKVSVLARETDEEANFEAAGAEAGPGTLLGSFDTLAERLAQYAAIGITHFVFSAQPLVEEAYRIGQHLLPRLRTRIARDLPSHSVAA